MMELPAIRQGLRGRSSLLLLHGFMGSCRDWEPLLPVLAEFFDCVAIDLPGHGQAAEIDWSFQQTVDYLIALQQQLNSQGPSYLCGYSLGGRLALAAALQSPQSWQGVILESASLGLVDEAARADRRRSDEGIARKLRRPDLDFAAFLNYWYAQELFAGLNESPGFAEMMARRLTSNPLGLACALEKLGLAEQPNFREALAHYDRPLLLMVGAWDQKFVAIGQEMASLCPSIQLEMVENSSHNVHAQQPDRWLTLVKHWWIENFSTQ